MRRIGFPVLVVMLVSALWACEKGATDGEQQETEGAAVSGEVEVSAEGSEFDPPVAVEQLPEGAWYCDMGTVHYASMEHGDGTCPICGMSLVQRPVAEPAPTPTEPAETEPPTTAPTPSEGAPAGP